MRQAPRSPLSFKLQRVANVPEHPLPSTRLMSCTHIANRQLSRIIGARALRYYPKAQIRKARDRERGSAPPVSPSGQFGGYLRDPVPFLPPGDRSMTLDRTLEGRIGRDV